MTEQLTIKNLDHLGLIAGITDDLNIENIDVETIYVADSALYTASNLAEMKKENLRWLTRVPLNVKKARERLINLEEKEWKKAEIKGYKYQEIIENYHGIKQRWLIVESEKRKQADREKLTKNIKKELVKIEKQIQKLCIR